MGSMAKEVTLQRRQDGGFSLMDGLRGGRRGRKGHRGQAVGQSSTEYSGITWSLEAQRLCREA